MSHTDERQMESTGEKPNYETPWLGIQGVVQGAFQHAVKMSHKWKNTLEEAHIHLHIELVSELNICIQLKKWGGREERYRISV